jgi:hypothetical protein
MGVGPPGSGCRARLQTTGRCAGVTPSGGERTRKRRGNPRQVRTRKANKSEPLMRRRKRSTAIETRLRMKPWDQARKGPAYGPGGGRRRSGASPVQALVWNVGTERPDAKGEVRGVVPRRARVPKRDAGADRSVVALKPGNAGGAKGPACPASNASQPDRGRARV